MMLQGDHFTYLPETDELIRDDVLKWLEGENRKEKSNKAPKEEQPTLNLA